MLNQDDARFQAYLEAMRRSRWFLLATTLLSSLLLCHIYVERCSLQEAGLVSMLTHRIESHNAPSLEARKNALEQAVSDVPPGQPLPADLVAQVHSYAESQFNTTVGQNELAARKVGSRLLPFVGFEIPWNDYVPVMAAMLVVFVIGVWLNTRTILSCLNVAGDGVSGQFLSVARFFFTFTGAMDQRRQTCVATLVQYGAVWLPCISLAIVGIADLLPLIASPHKVPDYPWLMGCRIAILSISWLLILSFSILTSICIHKLDGKVTGRMGAEGPSNRSLSSGRGTSSLPDSP